MSSMSLDEMHARQVSQQEAQEKEQIDEAIQKLRGQPKDLEKDHRLMCLLREAFCRNMFGHEFGMDEMPKFMSEHIPAEGRGKG